MLQNVKTHFVVVCVKNKGIVLLVRERGFSNVLCMCSMKIHHPCSVCKNRGKARYSLTAELRRRQPLNEA